MEARDSEWQWHQLGQMQVCTSLQTDNHANTSPLIFTGRMPFLPPNQQRQSNEGASTERHCDNKLTLNTAKLQLQITCGWYSKITADSQSVKSCHS